MVMLHPATIPNLAMPQVHNQISSAVDYVRATDDLHNDLTTEMLSDVAHLVDARVPAFPLLAQPFCDGETPKPLCNGDDLPPDCFTLLFLLAHPEFIIGVPVLLPTIHPRLEILRRNTTIIKAKPVGWNWAMAMMEMTHLGGVRRSVRPAGTRNARRNGSFQTRARLQAQKPRWPHATAGRLDNGEEDR
jgi:hypothetical protein